MSQICYNIVAQLQKKDTHIRGLAKSLNTNHMTIMRRVHELEKLNIVDYRTEGKNKIYYLKKTLEAKEYLIIVEHNKLMQLIKKQPLLRIIIEKIKSDNNIHLALLFGSYAKGTQTKKSDIDIYIKSEDANIKTKLQMINSRLSVKIGEFDTDNLLIKEIIKNHIIIKGFEEYYELLHQKISKTK